MATKRKRKSKAPEKELYTIQVRDWDIAYHFGINTTSKKTVEGVYWEHSGLVIRGDIHYPEKIKASRAKINLNSDPKKDDHWSEKPTILSAEAIGFMEIPRGDDTLICYCSIPSLSIPYLAFAMKAGKIKYVKIWGDKLKWRQGSIYGFRISKYPEDD